MIKKSSIALSRIPHCESRDFFFTVLVSPAAPFTVASALCCPRFDLRDLSFRARCRPPCALRVWSERVVVWIASHTHTRYRRATLSTSGGGFGYYVPLPNPSR